MKLSNPNIKSLIRKYLDGTLSDEECQVLNEWIGESSENRTLFHNECDAWNPEVSREMEDNWNNFSSWLRVHDLQTKSRTRSDQPWGVRVIQMTNRQFLRYAALFVIGLSVTFLTVDFFRNASQANDETNWITASTIAGQKSKLVLPDSTLVWLNAETTLSFQSGFNRQKNRIVKLEGEAFFDVAKQGNHTFVVRSDDYDVEVKGTQFNVMAYKDFKRTETTLVEGAVTIVKGDRKVNLLPGERVIYANDYLSKSKAHVRQAILWKDNKFYFDNIPFKELARRLERWYDVHISLNDPALNDILYSGYFKNEETVWQVLDVIQMTTPISYERKEHREIAIELK